MTVRSVIVKELNIGTRSRSGVCPRYVYVTVTTAESAGATLFRAHACQGWLAAVRLRAVAHGGVARCDIVPRACLPGLARRNEVKLLAVHDRAAVELVGPGIDLTHGLG